jgi:hypothetical protein
MARISIENKSAALGHLSRADLTERWERRFGCPPPTGVRLPFLVRAAAWQDQERAMGGMSISTKRLLKAALKQAEGKFSGGEDRGEATASISDSDRQSLPNDEGQMPDRTQPRSPAMRSVPLPGTRLIREWNGKRYVVDVTTDGYLMSDERYKSLTAIAYAITGARWSGPRFFGL